MRVGLYLQELSALAHFKMVPFHFSLQEAGGDFSLVIYSENLAKLLEGKLQNSVRAPGVFNTLSYPHRAFSILSIPVPVYMPQS